MVKKTRSPQRREDSLSRDRIVDASIELLDSAGEGGLTFRALSERLATGPGAIYWHVANKGDLLVAACDAVIAGVMAEVMAEVTAEVAAAQVDAKAGAQAGTPSPEDTIRALALGMFDAMDEHPWIGSALFQSAGALPTVRLFECIGRQVRALGAPAAGSGPRPRRCCTTSSVSADRTRRTGSPRRRASSIGRTSSARWPRHGRRSTSATTRSRDRSRTSCRAMTTAATSSRGSI
ncbi:TetR/AcrR family transcriptional regulator [Roseateles chitinivorans]|uniref:TetR/AcrR family transcriptional regulator n=1 Tax=Roseateles chitinivorans TaxID=2917965 RepID=UPI003D6676E8